MAQKIIEFIQSGENESDLLAWTTGWNEWKNYLEVPEICKEIDKLNSKSRSLPPPLAPSASVVPPLPTSIPKALPQAPPTHKRTSEGHNHTKNTKIQNQARPAAEQHPPEKTPPATKTNNTTGSPKTTPALGPFPHHRKHQRVIARFKCIIRSSSITFRTFTRDISLGGISLEDEIPSDLIGIECMVYIGSTKTNQNLKFKIALTERCVAKYFSFQDAEPKVVDELSHWLQEHQKAASAAS